jgi:lysophospholipase L1-like esterase/pimeloyl-ACP methyl ester carboxylesterase
MLNFVQKSNSMKHLAFLLLYLISICPQLTAQIASHPDHSEHPKKVACIGTSITYGARILNIPLNAYPAQLGRLLGDSWVVRNFGVNGSTILKKGDLPYWNTQSYEQAKEFLPDIVIVEIGTNDSKPQNWKYKNELYDDYKNMIKGLRTLKSSPEIYLCIPPPVFLKGENISDSIIQNIIVPIIKQIGREENLRLIDLNTLLKGHPELFPDRLHPDEKGAGLIAIEIGRILTGKPAILNEAEYPGCKTSWHGFDCYEFQYNLLNARIVVPHISSAGHPWIWRAIFPEWHYEMDSILLQNGLTLVYLNLDDMLGSPGAIKLWDDFYNYLTTAYHLNKKVALEGVSRGGLYIYRFAKTYPERVSCIYAEAPVCDIRSWPGGRGKGEGAPDQWEMLLKEYNLSEDQALKYSDNPFDNLEGLAKFKIPVWHNVGMHDTIVPVEENSLVLYKNYLEAGGGPITIYANTLTGQRLRGHHFKIDNVGAAADFILSNSNPKISRMECSQFHNYREGLQNSYRVFKTEKKGRVAFMGGSITYGNGWRDSIMAYLQRRFPETKFDFIQAGIPSMGSTPGAFRLQQDVLDKGRIDLFFEEAAVNDRGNEPSGLIQVRAMEGIIRHMRATYPACDMVMMHFADPEKMADYRKGIIPAEIKNHEKVAEYYNIPSLNLAREVTSRIDAGEFSWENDFIDLHPSPFGQNLYYESLRSLLENCWRDIPVTTDSLINHSLPEKLDKYCYDKGKLIPVSDAKASRGWELIKDWSPKDSMPTRENFVHVPMLVTEKPGENISLGFTGKGVGIVVVAGPDAGIIEFNIDKGKWERLNLMTPWSFRLHLPWYYVLKDNLLPEKHVLTLRLSADNSSSKIASCRIRYFFINE